MQELICMIIFSIIYLVWGFYIVLFPDKFKKSIEKSSRNGIRLVGLTIAGASIISLGWIYLIVVVGRLMEKIYQ